MNFFLNKSRLLHLESRYYARNYTHILIKFIQIILYSIVSIFIAQSGYKKVKPGYN